jgi:hypothetical protein
LRAELVARRQFGNLLGQEICDRLNVQEAGITISIGVYVTGEEMAELG